MSDLIRRQEVKEILRTEWVKLFPIELDPYLSLAMEKIYNIQSAEPLTEEDFTELRDRYGKEVEFVVRDMITGKGERWTKINE